MSVGLGVREIDRSKLTSLPSKAITIQRCTALSYAQNCDNSEFDKCLQVDKSGAARAFNHITSGGRCLLGIANCMNISKVRIMQSSVWNIDFSDSFCRSASERKQHTNYTVI